MAALQRLQPANPAGADALPIMPDGGVVRHIVPVKSPIRPGTEVKNSYNQLHVPHCPTFYFIMSRTRGITFRP